MYLKLNNKMHSAGASLIVSPAQYRAFGLDEFRTFPNCFESAQCANGSYTPQRISI